jgi:hypothetical protein
MNNTIQNQSPTPDCGSLSVTTGWAPIESAPKTKRAILAYCADNLCQYVIAWDEDYKIWRHFAGWIPTNNKMTHWMSLPAPPSLPNT